MGKKLFKLAAVVVFGVSLSSCLKTPVRTPSSNSPPSVQPSTPIQVNSGKTAQAFPSKKPTHTISHQKVPLEGDSISKVSNRIEGNSVFKVSDRRQSLSVISTMLYGTCKRWKQIAEWNHLQAPYRIYLGQKLVVHGKVEATPEIMQARFKKLWDARRAKLKLAKLKAKNKPIANATSLMKPPVQKSHASIHLGPSDPSAPSVPLVRGKAKFRAKAAATAKKPLGEVSRINRRVAQQAEGLRASQKPFLRFSSSYFHESSP